MSDTSSFTARNDFRCVRPQKKLNHHYLAIGMLSTADTAKTEGTHKILRMLLCHSEGAESLRRQQLKLYVFDAAGLIHCT